MTGGGRVAGRGREGGGRERQTDRERALLEAKRERECGVREREASLTLASLTLASLTLASLTHWQSLGDTDFKDRPVLNAPYSMRPSRLKFLLPPPVAA